MLEKFRSDGEKRMMKIKRLLGNSFSLSSSLISKIQMSRQSHSHIMMDRYVIENASCSKLIHLYSKSILEAQADINIHIHICISGPG